MVSLCGLASASPTSDPTAGRAVFTGATLPSATSIALDPAALGLGTTDEAYVAVTSVIDQLDINRRVFDLATGDLSAGHHVRDTTFGPGASLAGIWHAIPEVTLGFELRSPPSQVFPSGDNSLRYYSLGGRERDYYLSAAASFRVTDDFYAGFSIMLDKTYLSMSYARDTALANGQGAGGVNSDCGSGMACGLENQQASERYDLSVRQTSPITNGYIVNLGLVYKITHDLTVAVAYHTPPGGSVETELDGKAGVTLPARQGGEILHGGSTINISYPASVDAEVSARLNRDLELHIGGRWEDTSRFSAWDVRVYGSSFLGTDVPEWTERPRALNNSYAFWGGVEQKESDQRLRLGARIGFETASVPEDQTSPLTIAPFSGTLDLGAQLRIASTLSVQVTYGLQYFVPVHVNNSQFNPNSQLECIGDGFDYSSASCAAVRNGYAIPTAAGDYERIEHAVRIGMRYEFP